MKKVTATQLVEGGVYQRETGADIYKIVVKIDNKIVTWASLDGGLYRDNNEEAKCSISQFARRYNLFLTKSEVIAALKKESLQDNKRHLDFLSNYKIALEYSDV